MGHNYVMSARCLRYIQKGDIPRDSIAQYNAVRNCVHIELRLNLVKEVDKKWVHDLLLHDAHHVTEYV